VPKKSSKSKKTTESIDTHETLSTALSIDMMGSLTVLDSVTDLLKNPESLNTIVDYCSQGGSIESIEMALGIEDGLLEQWLRLGKVERDGPYRALYLFYSKASAGVRLMAETALLAKSPEKWLEKIEPRNRLRQQPTNSSGIPTIEGTAQPKLSGPAYVDPSTFGIPHDPGRSNHKSQDTSASDGDTGDA